MTVLLVVGFQWKKLIFYNIKMFCGYKPSAPENIEDIRQKWDKRNLTYCITNLTPKMTKESIHQQIYFAFKVYKNILRLNLKNEPCDIKISFCEQDHGDGFPFHGAGGVLDHEFYSGPGIVGDLHFDAEKN